MFVCLHTETFTVRLPGSTSDGCCPLGWDIFGTSCYLFSKTPLNWNDAKDWCNGHEAHLVVLTTDEEWVRRSLCDRNSASLGTLGGV